jgi:hypothetical protein
MAGVTEEFTPRERAEDILLGGLGYGEGAHILEVQITEFGYRGVGVWSDGERFDFESSEGLSELERWALGVVSGSCSLSG